MSKGIFITGTGTDLGKTYVSGLIVKKLVMAGCSAAYYKAALSGNEYENGVLIPGDAKFVKQMAGLTQPLEDMVPYVYEHAVSPHLASKMEGNPVCMDVVLKGYEKLKKEYEYITMEGSGGIICPLRYDDQKIWLEDVVQALDLDCVIVADAGLGTINSTVLTASYLNQKKIGIRGIIFNHYIPGDVMQEDNIQMVREMTKLPILACITKDQEVLSMDIKELQSIYR